MNDREKLLEELRQEIFQASSVDEVSAALAKLEQIPLPTEPEGGPHPRGLYGMIFRSLQDLTVDRPSVAGKLILEKLLPICVRSTSSEDGGTTEIYQARERLVKWLAQYPHPALHAVRDPILERLIGLLEEQDPPGVCVTLGRIGLRRPDIVKALWKVAGNHANSTGDTALATLIHLGVGSEERKAILAEAHSRILQRCSPQLVYALRQLSDSIDVKMAVQYLSQFRATAGYDYKFDLLLRLLPDIADAHPDNAVLQDEVWKAFMHSFQDHFEPEQSVNALALGSDLAPRCDSPHVMLALIGIIEDAAENSEKAGHRRYIMQLRLAECVRPRQLSAWGTIADDSKLLSILQADVEKDTENPGRSSTWVMSQKETAWETLLRLGCARIFDWFNPVIAAETNPYIQRQFCEDLACFCLDPLPESIVNWIREEYDLNEETKKKGDWAYRPAAINVAWSSATEEALLSLLGCGLTYDGYVPTQLINAAADVAVALARSGKKGFYKDLIRILTGPAKKTHQIVAAGVIESLARHGLLPEEFIPQLEICITDSDRDGYLRALLASAFGFLPQSFISSQVWHCLKQLAEQEEWHASHALEALARHNRLIEFEDLLVSKLGLNKDENGWVVSAEEASNQWTAYFVSWLFLSHGSDFAQALSTVLKHYPWASVVQALELLQGSPGKIAGHIQDIGRLLVRRTVEKQTSFCSETEIFHYMGVLVPDTFAKEPWDKYWDQWLPEGRQALAKALGEAEYDTVEGRTQAIRLLVELINDGLYAVRRSAYRSLSMQSSESLLEWIDSTSGPDVPVEMRKRSAEASEWWIDGENQRKSYEEITSTLARDPELVVRETTRSAQENRRRREWAQIYLERISEISEWTSDQVFALWPYAEALTRLGDDMSLVELCNRLDVPKLPPNARFLLKRIDRKLKKNWQKRTKKWPEPWVSYEGRVTTGKGVLVLAGGAKIPVLYTVWHKPALTPSRHHQVNGVIFPQAGDFLLMDLPDGDSRLQLEDGSDKTILITQSQPDSLTFVGQKWT